MEDQSRSKIIAENPIGKGLDSFRAAFGRICESKGISCSPKSLDHLNRDDLQKLAIVILSALQGLRASRLLPAEKGGNILVNDLSTLVSTITSDDSDFVIRRIQPLLQDALAVKSDGVIWRQVYNAVTEHTTPPQTIASFPQQTPWLRNKSSFVDSSEHRKHVDGVLKEELGPLACCGISMTSASTTSTSPPACKGAGGSETNAYDVYDLYDLGEFEQKGSRATKWGSKEDLVELSRKAEEVDVGLYFDAVLNHKAGADEKEKYRTKDVGESREIEAWLGFNFTGRGDKNDQMGIYRILGENKYWSSSVADESGNSDFLMYADVDYSHPEVQRDSGDAKEMLEDLDFIESQYSLFDSPLLYNFSRLSTTERSDLRTVFDGDLYGIKGDGGTSEPPACGGQLADIILARKLYAYGGQDDYWDDANCTGFVRRGTADHPAGLVCVMSNAESGQIKMNLGDMHRGEIWTDVLQWQKDEVVIDGRGFGMFPCPATSVSIWVRKDAAGRERIGVCVPG
ncbi:ubiquitin thioesterase OTU1 [Apiospora arundinis]